jgi:hypothetical protein
MPLSEFASGHSAYALRAHPLEGDSRVADVMVGPRSPEYPDRYRTDQDERGCPQADCLAI